MAYYVDLEWICRGLYNLAMKHWRHFEQSQERAELDKSIFHGRIAVGLYPERHGDRKWVLTILGSSFLTRFNQYGKIEDLEEATERYRAALELCPDGCPDRSTFLNNLASALATRFTQNGRTADLDEAIIHQRTALELRPEDHPDRSVSLENLASGLGIRFEQYGRIADLNESIKHHHAALELRPVGHPNRSITLFNLAKALHTQFVQNGQTVDLDEAIKYQCNALDLCPDGHPNRFASLICLARALHSRFTWYGRAADLDEAIKHERAALGLCPNGHPNRYMCLGNLASSLHTRFKQYGETAELDEAIMYQRAALKLCPSDHSNHCSSRNNLANSLHTRFKQHGQTADLNEAISHYSAALEHYPKGHPSRFTSLNNLASALGTRFKQHRQIEDLNESINHHRDALKLCMDGHPNRLASLINLANSLLTRFEQNGQTADLDEVIDRQRAALKTCPGGYSNRFVLLNGLANALHTRFKQHGQITDLDEAMEHYRTSLELCPDGHPDRSLLMVNLGLSFLSRFETFSVVDDFEECMQLLEHAAGHKFSSSVTRLTIASQWAELARSRSHHTTSRAYKAAMLLLQHTLVFCPSLHTQHNFLTQKQYGMLALDAVAYAIEGNRLEEAVEILERGRTLLWSQMRGLRTPLDRLARINRELADRFRDISRQLENLATSSTVQSVLQSDSNTTGSSLSVLDMHEEQQLLEEMLRLKKQLSHEKKEVINEIRQIPGFGNFLEATPFEVLQRAALQGPVIVVNHCRYRSDALIVLSREDLPAVVCVPLDGDFYMDSGELYSTLLVIREEFGADSQAYDITLCIVMKMLWDRVVCKVVDKLKELGIAEGSRIWWCPTYTLSILPFHAAGPFEGTDGNSVYLLDKYISSYTPTLGALIDARSSPGNREEPSALVIGDTSLPSAREEIRNVRNCGINPKLLSSKASHDAVVKALQKATWVHFACHGGLDPKPFNSSFKVSDRGLTLLDIIQANLPNAEFAFLSACHTAEQPRNSFTFDEVLHLAAAMQFSGFRSVIGSMWELLDVDGPFFARVVYQYMFDCDDGEARYKRAAAGLRKAAVELKARDDIRTERWVNLIHIGA